MRPWSIIEHSTRWRLSLALFQGTAMYRQWILTFLGQSHICLSKASKRSMEDPIWWSKGSSMDWHLFSAKATEDFKYPEPSTDSIEEFLPSSYRGKTENFLLSMCLLRRRGQRTWASAMTRWPWPASDQHALHGLAANLHELAMQKHFCSMHIIVASHHYILGEEHPHSRFLWGSEFRLSPCRIRGRTVCLILISRGPKTDLAHHQFDWDIGMVQCQQSRKDRRASYERPTLRKHGKRYAWNFFLLSSFAVPEDGKISPGIPIFAHHVHWHLGKKDSSRSICNRK